jgi:hypothetical protein
VLVLLGSVCLLAACWPTAAGGEDATPTWQLGKYYSRGWDRSFKLDLVEELPATPRVVVFGGSRALRLDPATLERRTGLPAFNLAFHNGRPEDAWAVTDWLLDTRPDEPPAVVWCVQATTFADVPMATGLIVDKRLSQAFPASLIKSKLKAAMREPKRNLLSGRRFGQDGMLWWNRYDSRRAAGLTLRQSLRRYLSPKMLAKAGNRKVPGRTRAKAYFSRTLLLLNSRGIRPLIVIMPYHPTVREAFYRVGWKVKERAMRTYLKKLRQYRDFRVVNCLDIRSFGGSPDGFYDGAHLTAGNSRRLIRYLVKKAPGCFRLPPSPTPTPLPSASPSPEASPAAVSAPAPTPVPEVTGTPADFLE